MQVVQPAANCVFIIDDNNDAHCFSYGKEVAAYLDGTYIEYTGEKFFSKTSNKHKSMFRNHFGIERSY